jgi:hypothetical protein
MKNKKIVGRNKNKNIAVQWSDYQKTDNKMGKMEKKGRKIGN